MIDVFSLESAGRHRGYQEKNMGMFINLKQIEEARQFWYLLFREKKKVKRLENSKSSIIADFCTKYTWGPK